MVGAESELAQLARFSRLASGAGAGEGAGDVIRPMATSPPYRNEIPFIVLSKLCFISYVCLSSFAESFVC